MHKQIRLIGLILVIAFVVVFAQLNYLQIFAANRIASNPSNVRALLQEYSIERGDILTLDGVRIAASKKTGGKLKYRRVYPEGELYGHITGYYSIVYGADRIERSFDEQLLGKGGVVSMQDIEDRLLGSGEQGDDVRLTVNSELQEAARSALGDNRGSVVAIEPSTGEVRAMWSNPSYDPTPLAAHDSKVARRYWKSLSPTSRQSPLVNLSTSRGYPPGSTFKVVTAAAALEAGRFRPDSTFPDPVALDLPKTDNVLRNFTRQSCTGGGQIDLFTALRVSCDTTFGILGLRLHDRLRAMAEAMGFNEPLEFDVATEASAFPDVPDESEPLRAYAGIGQGDVFTTPLQMALVAATVANGGEVPRPRLVREVIDAAGGVVQRFDPEMLGDAMSQRTATLVKEMMIAVVESGTGTAAQIPGTRVAGKTGTAQTGVEGENPHTWFISFAPAAAPKIAVAVIVENGGSFGSEATGGAVAAPIARQVIEAHREIEGW